MKAVFGRKLSRDTNSRRALLKNLASYLLAKGFLTTTFAKARFAKSYVEKLITLARKGNLATKRSLASILTHEAFLKLTREIAPNFKNRTGGYTRIIKLSPRKGDNASMARLELVATTTSDQPSSKKSVTGKTTKIKKSKSATKSKNEKRPK